MLLKVAGLVALVGSARFAWWRLPVGYQRPRVLMYHMIGNHVRGSGLNKWRVKPEHFARQMRWLATHGWHTVTMSELMAADVTLDKTVAITFDDGFEHVYQYAMPILKQYGFKATVYVLTGVDENSWDRQKDIQREKLLTPRQIEAMLQTGLIEIGGHGVDHVNLRDLAEPELIDELAGCREVLQRRYGIQCSSFAYPFGQWDNRVMACVKQCGYEHAVVVGNRIMDRQHDNQFAIPRLTMDGRRARIWDFYCQLSRGRCK